MVLVVGEVDDDTLESGLKAEHCVNPSAIKVRAERYTFMVQ